MRLLLSALLLRILAVAIALQSPVSIDTLSGVPSSGQSQVQLTSGAYGLDAPKTVPINGSSFDWWYFDVVSPDLDYSFVLVFFAATSNGMWANTPDVGSAVYGSLGVSLPDGSFIEGDTVGSELVVTTLGDGSSGDLVQSGWSWVGSPDMSLYEVIVDSPSAAIQGTITFESTSPAHYPCELASAGAGQSLHLGGPDFGWANAVPDANAQVDFNFNGTKVKFSGAGYHDKNWGGSSVPSVVKAWYWGHARLGPLAVVWFNVIAPDGSEHVSSYVTRQGQVLTMACANMTVRATGANSEWPPVHGGGEPGGFHISAFVEGSGTLEIDVVHKLRLSADPAVTMYRWIGNVSGGFGNGIKWNGSALYEAFAF
ncbi:hypothetical protein PsYK624_078200 [Phanerochaete sordida]|uniref:Hydroxyneurosporene synthase n=1 Tax=Phanerochaete sordida TaxID=48140 RepID=A0A9P3GBM3_9APHY|nr:hypothetical protein PsYK624_078200 [Phanerochaete sordida]